MSAVTDAAAAAALFAVDPFGLGGVCLRSGVQPARTLWLEMLRDLLPHDSVMRRIPFNIADGRLLGGLDLTATLRANQPVAERGVLAAADGGVVVVTMAERLSAHTAACLNAVLDSGEIDLQREGVRIEDRACVGIVALDESIGEDERVPLALVDRLAFLVDLNGFDARTVMETLHDPEEIAAARKVLPRVNIDSGVLAALCGTGIALGAGSPRVCLLALRAAKASAALAGRDAVSTEDAVTAGRLVFAPRATQLPAPSSDSNAQLEPQPPQNEEAQQASHAAHSAHSAEHEAPESPGDALRSSAADAVQSGRQELDDVVLQATQAAIPRGLLEDLLGPGGRAESRMQFGRAGMLRGGGSRGRPAAVVAGIPTAGARLNLIETLRAAAPWQRLRGRPNEKAVRIRVGAEDLRVTRFQQRSQTLTIFVVDASGSSALNRLAEAKGAVELLLADCYIRRDQVAVIAFRGRAAELLLPPTRSLVRAKRSLAGLPGGGGTPLAAAIASALELANQARRRGMTPTLVLLSDGRANVARDGKPGREGAMADASSAALAVCAARVAALFIDTSPRPSESAQYLAAALRARYVALPFATAKALNTIITDAVRATR